MDEALSLAAGFSSSGGFPGFVFLFSLDGEGRQEEVLRHEFQVIELPAGVHLVRFGKVGLLRGLFRLQFRYESFGIGIKNRRPNTKLVRRFLCR